MPIFKAMDAGESMLDRTGLRPSDVSHTVPAGRTRYIGSAPQYGTDDEWACAALAA